MVEADDVSKRGWRSVRFTISELLLLMAGLALGLAYSRVDGSDAWPDFVLACFGGFFVVGHAQKTWRMWANRRQLGGLSAVDAFSPGALAALMIFSGTMLAAASHRWWAFQHASGERSWVIGDLVEGLFYLIVFCGYFANRNTPSKQGIRRWFAFGVDASVGLLGLYWLSCVLEEGVLLWALVHVAIRGVELAQPTQLAGRPFYPANLHIDLTRQFVGRAFLTGTLLAGAAAAIVALAHSWSRGWGYRSLWATASCGCLVPAMWMVWWCVRVAFPQLSPFYYSAAQGLPPGQLAISLILVLLASAALSMRLCAEDRLIDREPKQPNPSQRDLHQWVFVPLAFLLAASWKGGTNITSVFGAGFGLRQLGWTFLYCFQAAISQPRWMLWLASLVVVGQCVWRCWRPLRPSASVRSTVPTAKFVAVWVFALWICLLVIPTAPWLGFALYLRRAGL